MDGINLSLLDVKFVLLLCSLVILRVIWPRKQQGVLVALGGAAVIGLASPWTVAVIAGISVFYLYPLHRLMRTVEERGSKQFSRVILWAGIAALVALLVGFKLDRYVAFPWFLGSWAQSQVLALVGFSYFIFRAISFLNIQSIIRIDERNPWSILSYALFPPTLTSGPIQKYQDFREQLANPVQLNRSLVKESGYRITRGYFRKTVIAFILNGAVEKLLGGDEMTIITSTIAVIVLYLYFYFDFAGYSDIAIGFGLLLGIRVPENFRKPFGATTISEFWRNWHITLVDWFRDHFFIPLGGMRSSRKRAGVLAFFTMVLCGFWHGVAAGFIAWGVWQGTLLFVEAVSGIKPIPPGRRSGVGYWSRVVWTNACVAFGSILFLPEDSIWKVLGGFYNW